MTARAMARKVEEISRRFLLFCFCCGRDALVKNIEVFHVLFETDRLRDGNGAS